MPNIYRMLFLALKWVQMIKIWIKKSSPHWDGGGNSPYPLVYLENPVFGNSYDPINLPQDVK